ncbi:Ig-like domain-containing protein [Larkinella sp. VNQ87]|uniref:Ig-like domain-containing protein n=1 Tax=Larkinella sp. VNQ87 TaxID=3400921 RepID=UPI003BFE6241
MLPLYLAGAWGSVSQAQNVPGCDPRARTPVVDFQLTYDPATNRYTTWYIPTDNSLHRLVTGQFTIVAPNGFTTPGANGRDASFQITNINGVWSPDEVVDNEYITSLGVATIPELNGLAVHQVGMALSAVDVDPDGSGPLSTMAPVTSGVPVPLFSFPGNGCAAVLRILVNGEPIRNAILSRFGANVNNNLTIQIPRAPQIPNLERYCKNAPLDSVQIVLPDIQDDTQTLCATSTSYSNNYFTQVFRNWNPANLPAGTFVVPANAQQWSGFTVTPSSLSANVSINATTGAYTVTFPVVGGVTQPGSVTICNTLRDSCNTASDQACVIVSWLSSGQVSITNNPTVCLSNGTTTVSLTATSGFASYDWTGPGLTATMGNPVTATLSAAGVYSYTVIVSNGQSCTASNVTSVTVLNGADLTGITPTNPTSCSGSDGMATLTGLMAGQSYSITYTRNGGAPVTQTLTANGTGQVVVTGLSAGIYSFTAFTGVCASMPVSVTLTDPNPPTVPTITVNPSATICLGTSLTLSATGSANASFNWVGSNLSQPTGNPVTATPNTAGSFVYTVTQTVNGCTSAPASTTVTVHPTPTVTATSTTVTACIGGSFDLTATPSGGTPGYLFTWNGPNYSTTTTANPVTVSNAILAQTGNYTVTVTDANGCTATGMTPVSVSVVNCCSLTATATSSQSVLCAGGNATLSVTTQGAIGTLTYQWSPNVVPGTSQSVTVSPTTATTYTVVVTDTGSPNCSRIATVTVMVNPAPVINLTTFSSTVCAGNSIQLTTNVTTGTVPPYTYVWTGPNFATTTTVNTVSVPNATTANSGSYTVVMTDANGCSATATTPVAVTVTPLPTFSLVPSNPTSCSGINGSIAINGLVSGQIYTVSYSQNGTGSQSSSQLASGGQIVLNNLTAGVYSVTVAINGCASAPQSVTLTDPTQPAPPVITPGPSTTICLGGSVTLTAMGTNLQWVGTNLTPLTGSPVIASPGTSGNFIYTVTQTVAGCASLPASVTVIVNPTPSIASVTAPPTCVGQPLSLSATITGGTLQYNVSWRTPDGLTLPGNPLTRSNAQVSMGGNYTVIVSDANSCTATQVVSTTVGASPNVQVQPQQACAGGDITLTATGGAGNYFWTGPNGFTATGQIVVLSNVDASDAGSYTVVVTGGNACTGTATGVVAVNPGPVIKASFVSTTVCIGSTLYLLGDITTGSVPPYQYNWVGPDGFSSTAQNPTISSAQVSNSGSYTFTITDKNGCSATTTTPVSVTVKDCCPPRVASISVTAQDPASCGGSNGSATVSLLPASPAGASLSYQWRNLVTNALVSTSASATGLVAGVYSVTITETINLSCVQSFTSTVAISEAPGPDVDVLSLAGANCGSANGSVSLSVTGGTTPYSISWSGAASGSTTASVSPVVINGLVAGSYSFRITSSGSTCQGTEVVSIPVLPTSLSLTAQVTQPITCGSSGTVVVSWNAVGGPYTLTVDGVPMAVNGTSQSLILAAGTHSLQIASGNPLCVSDSRVVLINPVPAPLVVGWSVSQQPVCSGDVGVISFGGGQSSATQYSLSQLGGSLIGVTGGDVGRSYPVGSGTYVVSRTEPTGCVSSDTLAVISPVAISYNVQMVDGSCGQGGSLSVNNIRGGTGIYLIVYSGPVSGTALEGQVVSGLPAGVYTVTVQDSQGCSISRTDSLTVGSAPSVVATISSQTVCVGGSFVLAANVTPVGSYTYSWNGPGGFVGTGATVTVGPTTLAQSGSYTVIVTTADGCSITQETTSPISVTPCLPTCSIGLNIIATSAHCNQSDGGATVTASGGSGSYNYRWSTGATTPTVSGLVSDVYSVTVSDAANSSCFSTTLVAVGNAGGPQLTVSSTSPAVCTGATGTASVTATGGVGIYSYRWNTGVNGPTVSGLISGIYSVTATDQAGCSDVALVTIPSSVGSLTATVSGTTALCGQATGSASVVASGSSGYRYLWSNGATTTTVNTLVAGIYSVTVTDGNGCWIVGSVSIDAVGGPTFTINKTDVNCYGTATGLATVNVVQSSGIPTYRWSTGALTASVNNLVAGVYSVTVTDGNGCASTDQAVIGQPSAIVAELTSSSIGCGSTVGTITVSNISGGTPTYNYQWNTGATGPMLSNVGPGSYTVTITDAQGCVATGTAMLSQPNCPLCQKPALTLTAPVCNTASGTYTISYQVSAGASVTATGGSHNATLQTITVSQGQSVTVVATSSCGTQSVLGVPAPVCPPAGCTASAGLSVGQALCSSTGTTYMASVTASPGASLSVVGGVGSYANGVVTAPVGSNVTVVASLGCSVQRLVLISPVSCTGTACETPLVSVSGPVCEGSTYSVHYVAGTGVTVSSPSGVGQLNLATQTLSGVPVGVSVSLTATNGSCTQIISILPPTNCLPICSPRRASISITALDPASCGGSNGSATATLLPGSPVGATLTYQWRNLATNALVSTSATASGLVAGVYALTITETTNNGACVQSFTTTVSISETPGPDVDVLTVSGANCGASNGSVQLSITGGSAPYSVNWSGASSGATTASVSPVTIQGLTAGNYTFTITSQGSTCQGTEFVSVPVLPTSLSLSTQITQPVTCGSSGTVVVSWNAVGGPYQLTVDGVTSSVAGTSQTLILAAGTHSIQIASGNPLCVSDSRVVVINPVPAPLVAGWSVTQQPVCAGQAGVISFVGGQSPGTQYSLSVLNGALIGVTAGDVTRSYSVGAGEYVVTRTEPGGCVSSTVLVVVSPVAISYNVQPVDGVCGQGGSLVVTNVSGGVGSYQLVYSGPVSGSLVEGQPVSGLPAGVYTITVSGGNGCSISRSVSLSVAAGPSVVATINSSTACVGGSFVLNATVSPVGSYTYTWFGPTGLVGSGPAVTVGQATLAHSGSYTVVVTSATGCSTSQVTTTGITISTCAPVCSIGINVIATAAHCNLSDGQATVSASGGSGSYLYRWSTGATTPTITAVATGVYSITVTDATNSSCFSTTLVAVGNAGGPQVTLLSTTPALCGQATGTASVTANGGSSYQYQWNNGQATNILSGVVAGTYSVTVTDQAGCKDVLLVTIPDSAGSLTATASGTASTCGQAMGTATVVASGGSGNYLYRWSTGNTSASISNLISGVYSVTVSDTNGCSVTSTVSIDEVGGPLFTINKTNVSCYGTATGTATVNVTTSVSVPTYRWSTGAVTANINNLVAGVYSVTVTDGNGCRATDQVVIGQPAPLVAELTSSSIACGSSTGSITLSTVSGGTPTYTYLWSNGLTSSSLVSVGPGSYTVTVTDALGCVAKGTATLSLPTNCTTCQAPLLTLSAPVCNTATGTYTISYQVSAGASVTVNGGTLNASLQMITVTQGQAVTVTATSSCGTQSQMGVPAPSCGLGCTVNAGLSAGQAICSGSGTYVASVTASAGASLSLVNGVGSYANGVVTAPVGTNVTVVASLGCSVQRLVLVSPASCTGTVCETPLVSVSGPVCEGSTYSVHYVAGAGVTVSSPSGVGQLNVATQTLSGVPVGVSVSLTVTNGSCMQIIPILPPTNCPITTCQKPILTVTDVVCSTATNSYSVSYLVSAGASVTASTGNVNAVSQLITGIAQGQTVTIAATSSCGNQTTTTVLSPSCSVSCTADAGLSVGQAICLNTGSGTYVASVTASAGASLSLVNGVGSYANGVVTAPVGTNVTVVASLGCSTERVVINGNVTCDNPCANPLISIGGTSCEGTTYSVRYTAPTGATVTSSRGTVNPGTQTIAGIQAGLPVSITVTNGQCTQVIDVLTPTDCPPVCQAPALTLSNPVCNTAANTYSVGYMVTEGVITVSSNVGQVNEVTRTITGIPLGQDVIITARNLVCGKTTSMAVKSPACPVGCTAVAGLSVGQGICQNGSTYVASVMANPGASLSLVNGVGSYANGIVTAPVGTNVTVVAALGCSIQAIEIVSPTCTTPCEDPLISVGGTSCGGTTYSVQYTVSVGVSVTANAGFVNAATQMITGIPAGTPVSITAANGACVPQVMVVSSPVNCTVCHSQNGTITVPAVPENSRNWLETYTLTITPIVVNCYESLAYLVTDVAGTILYVSNTPSFTGVAPGTYLVYATTRPLNSIIGKNINTAWDLLVDSPCMWIASAPYVMVVCASTNEPPLVPGKPVITEPGKPITVCLPITDPNPGDTHTTQLCAQPAHGTVTTPVVDNQTHQVCFTYTPDPAYTGMDQVCLITCDQGGLCDTTYVPITIVPTLPPTVDPKPPVVPVTPIVTITGIPKTECYPILDPNVGDVHSYTVCGQPAHGTVNVSINNQTHQVCVTYTPNAGYSGPDQLCLHICDQTGLCTDVIIPIVVIPIPQPPTVPQPPIVVPPVIVTPVDVPQTVCVQINDPNVGDFHTTRICGQPTAGTLTVGAVNNQTHMVCVTYTPPPGYSGQPLGGCLEVCDQAGLCTQVPVTITVIPDPSTPCPTISSISTNPTTCTANNGSVTLLGLTAGQSYTVCYTKDQTAPLCQTLTANQNGRIVLSGLGVGVYTNITVSQNSCTSNALSAVLSGGLPAPTATCSVTAVCMGESITLTASGTNIQWFGPGLLSNTGSPVTAIPNVTGIVTYSAIQSANGCVSPPAVVTVVVKPTPTFSLTATNPTVCNGTDGSMTLSGLTPGQSYTVCYTKDGGLPVCAERLANVNGLLVISGLSAGSYTNITVNELGCLSVPKAITLTNPALPAPTITVAPSTTICLGQPISLTASGAPGATFTWKGLGLLGTTGSVVTANPQSTGTLSYTVTQTIAGCGSSFTVTSITVNPVPSAVVISKTDPTNCANPNGVITLGGLLSNQNYTVCYRVNNAGSPVCQQLPSNATGNIALNGLTSGVYSVTVSNGGCSSQPVSATLTGQTPVQPTVNVLPSATVCLGQSVTLTASSSAQGTFTWSGPDLSGVAGGTLTTTPTATGVLTYTVTQNVNGCTSIPATVSITVVAIPAPTLVATTAPTTCSGTNGSLTLGGLTANQSFTVCYSRSGAAAQCAPFVATGSGQLVVTGLTSGAYSLTVVSAGGCRNAVPVSASVASSTACSVCSNAPLIVAQPMLICKDSTKTVSMQILDADPGDSFTATACGVGMSNATVTVGVDNQTRQLSITYQAAPGFIGIDQVCVTVTDKCGNTDQVYVPIQVIRCVCGCTGKPPVVVPQPIITTINQPKEICVPIVDTPTDTHTATVCGGPQHGTVEVTVNNQTHLLCVKYTPSTNYVGTDKVCITICDQTNRCTVIEVPITVVDVPNPPVLSVVPVVTNCSSTTSAYMPILDVNVDNTHSVTVVSQPLNGTVLASVDQLTHRVLITYIPAPGFTGNDKAVVRVTDSDGLSSADTEVPLFVNPDTCPACVTMELKVLLEGPYNTTTQRMNTVLNQRGLLPGQTPIGQFAVATPPGQPYNTAPWNYTGTENVTTYAPDVVDWVLVSLRTDELSTTPVFRVAGLLHDDGRITFVNPCFSIPDGSYHVVIEHRNHMGVMSPTKVSIVNSQLVFDFTLQDSYKIADPPSFGEIAVDGKWMMYGGDGKKDTFSDNFDINFYDSNLWKDESGIFDQYRKGDFNMDADVNFADSVLWKKNNGRYSKVPH